MPLVRKPPDGAAPDDDLAGGLGADLASASAGNRWAAARAAANRPDSVPALAEALSQESDARVREALFTALTRIATPEAVLAILPYLRSDDSSLRTGAMDALRAMPQLVEPHLKSLLADPDGDVRLLACDLARNMNSEAAPRLLCALIETEAEANVCAVAVDVLAEIADSGAIEALRRCAGRFPDDPFLTFAISVASDRLNARPDRG